MQQTRSPELEPMNVLIGAWTTEATHPALEGTISGRASFEWLEGERFLIQRSQVDHPEVPDGIAIVGAVSEGPGLSMYYFDSRGVHRIYRLSIGDGVLRIWRDAPGFAQRFTGTFGDDGNTLAGLWRLSRDGSTWDDDLEITFRRVA
jgi:hypothetical protein